MRIPWEMCNNKNVDVVPHIDELMQQLMNDSLFKKLIISIMCFGTILQSAFALN